MNRRLAVFAITCLWVQVVYSQPRLAVGKQGFIGLSDTVLWGSKVNFSVYIVNKGNQPFNGQLDLGNSVNSAPRPVMASGTFNNFVPGDSVQLLISNYDIFFPGFTPNADNIVVAWPIPSTVDSVVKTIYVKNPYSGVSSIPLENKQPSIKLFPNPVREVVYLEGDMASQVFCREINKVRIINIASQEVHFRDIEGNRISLQGLPSGLYIVEIPVKDGENAHYKINKVE